jgi:hypothetical protein
MSTIQLFKLVSGEEVVATVLEEDSTQITMKNARTFIVVPQGANSYALELVPLLKGEPDGRLKMYKHAIAAVADVSSDLERAYISRTTGIEIASSLTPLMG